MRKLSKKTLCAIRSYTDDQSTTINMSLLSRAGLSNDVRAFDGTQWEKISLIISAIYNAPLVDDSKLYQVYKPNYKEFILLDDLTLNTILREDASLPIINTFFQSTTKDPDVISFLSLFHEAGCCIREINVKNFPILDLSELSSYEFQKEVIVPPYLVFFQARLSEILEFEELVPDVVRENVRKVKNTSYGDCTDGGGYQYILDVERINKVQKTKVPLKVNFSTVTPYYILPEFVDYINKVITVFYCRKPTHHGQAHICNTIILTLILYSSLLENRVENFDKEVLSTAIMTALFHDSGRDCKDGKDVWEEKSADNAKTYIPKACGVDGEIVGKLIHDPKSAPAKYENAYLAYKGADSIDIGRVTKYDPTKNPARDQNQKTNILIDKLPNEIGDFGVIINNIESYDPKYELEEYLDELFQYVEPDEEDTNGNIILKDVSSFEKKIIITKQDVAAKMTKENISEKRAIKELKVDAKDVLENFNTTLKASTRYFIENRYLKNEIRYFHDYIEILLFFIPYMPYTMGGLSNFIIPFIHRNLYKCRL